MHSLTHKHSPDDEATDSSFASPNEMCADPDDEFPKDWLSIVQGITPVNQDDAVKLAALQYQAYFLDRTAVHSTVGFCRYSTVQLKLILKTIIIVLECLQWLI